MQWFIGNRAEVSQVALLCVAQSQVAIKERSVKVIEVILSQDQPLNGKSSPGGWICGQQTLEDFLTIDSADYQLHITLQPTETMINYNLQFHN